MGDNEKNDDCKTVLPSVAPQLPSPQLPPPPVLKKKIETVCEPLQDAIEPVTKPAQPIVEADSDQALKKDDSSKNAVHTPPKHTVLPPDVTLATEVLMKILECGRLGSCNLSTSVTTENLIALLDFAKIIFMSQPVCVEINGPVNVCGDIHGQFSDLLRLFDKLGFPNRANYLFLGDYVDRGKHGMETVLLLICYKIILPNNIVLLRGNHECPFINRVYGFYDECIRRKPNSKLWEAFQDCFSTMPLTAVISDRILCMHGGISHRICSFDQLRKFQRPMYQPDNICAETDILWSDPSKTVTDYGPNVRGVSVVFGVGALNRFLKQFNLDLIIRAHQVVQDGYEFFGNRRLVTIFSAPFYCGEFNNAAAVLSVRENLVCSFTKLKPHTKKKIRKWKIL